MQDGHGGIHCFPSLLWQWSAIQRNPLCERQRPRDKRKPRRCTIKFAPRWPRVKEPTGWINKGYPSGLGVADSVGGQGGVEGSGSVWTTGLSLQACSAWLPSDLPSPFINLSARRANRQLWSVLFSPGLPSGSAELPTDLLVQTPITDTSDENQPGLA